MGQNVTQKLIASHLVDGQMEPGTPIGLRIDQTLTQDATGTLVMLELEAMHRQRVQTEFSAQYVDHNLLQTDARVDDTYYQRAMEYQQSGSLIVGGHNYGQGSSREHAALAPRYLGVKAVITKSFARIHRQNLINFGILPLTFVDPDDWQCIDAGGVLILSDIRDVLCRKKQVEVRNEGKQETYMTEHALSDRELASVLAGSLISLFRQRHQDKRRGGY